MKEAYTMRARKQGAGRLVRGPKESIAREALRLSKTAEMKALDLDAGVEYVTTFTTVMRSPLSGTSLPHAHPEFSYEEFVDENGFIKAALSEEDGNIGLNWNHLGMPTIVVDGDTETKVLLLTVAGVLWLLIKLPSQNARRALRRFDRILTNPEQGEKAAVEWLLSQCELPKVSIKKGVEQ